MIEIMNTKDGETHELDPQLWHACAGGMVQMPPINSKVIYFPQGHIEHAQVDIDYKKLHPLPPLVPCRISSITYLADRENDEVYAKIRLVPIKSTDTLNDDNDGGNGDGGFVVGGCGNESNEFGSGCDKTASFAKTLTQSDANNGGGFSVPRYCAETIFPRLDYSAEPPVQTILAKDVHGVTWKFRHIYRGTPRRHLLTTGWSNFVNQKKLVAGDSIVFLRAENGDLCVGIRRAKKGIGCGPESPSSYSSSGWTGNGNGGFSAFLRDDIRGGLNRMSSSNTTSIGGVGSGFVGTIGKAVPESVIEAVNQAARGQPFEVIYYPRASTPEFCVKASAMRAAMQIQWCSGMRFKMAFETEDSSRISWFMGTISAVQVADPIRWPGSPWRLIQVTWDEPDLLRNVKRVNPWLVEIVSSVPNIHHMSPFSSPRKKLRLVNPHAPYDFPMINQMRMMPPPPTLQTPGFPPSNINISSLVGIEGARHAQFTKCCLPRLNNNNKTQQQQHHLGLFPSLLSYHQTSAAATHHLTRSPPINFVGKPPSGNKTVMDNGIREDDISCLLTMGNNNKKLENQIPKGSDDSSALVAAAKFMLFGKPILTEEQISGTSSSSGDCSSGSSSSGSSSNSGVAAANLFPGSNNSSSTADKKRKIDFIGLTDTTDHCKVFMESEDVGRTLDLSVIGSYEEMFNKLENMFGMERPEMLSNVMYRDCSGATKHVTGDLDKPFSEFLRTARRLTILTDGRGDNMAR